MPTVKAGWRGVVLRNPILASQFSAVLILLIRCQIKRCTSAGIGRCMSNPWFQASAGQVVWGRRADLEGLSRDDPWCGCVALAGR